MDSNRFENGIIIELLWLSILIKYINKQLWFYKEAQNQKNTSGSVTKKETVSRDEL